MRSIIVVGAGVIGAAIALELTNKGFKVSLIDKGEAGHGASIGNASALAATEIVPIASPGLIKQVPKWLLDPEGPLTLSLLKLPQLLPWLIRFLANTTVEKTETSAAALASLANRSKADTKIWLDNLNVKELLVENNTLRLYPSEAGFQRDAYRLDLRRRHGVEMDVLNSKQIEALEPSIKAHYDVGVLTHGAHYFRDPLLPITSSVERLKALGGEFINAQVQQLATTADGKAEAMLSNGKRLQADKLVLASGIQSKALAATIGDHFPLESERGYHVHFSNMHTGLSRTLVDTSLGLAVTPMDSGLRIAGTVEFSSADLPPNYARCRIIEKQAQAIFGNTLKSDDKQDWMGHRPSLPDGLPVLGYSKKAANICYAFGHGHLGLTFAATTAVLIGELLSGKAPSVDLAPFSPQRFRGGRLSSR